VEIWRYALEPEVRRNLPRRPREKRQPRKRRSDAIRACKRAFIRLVQSNLVQGKPPALVTLTMRDIVSIDDAYVAFTKFGTKIRKWNSGVSYIAVPEFQKRGAVHFHVLMFDLPDGIIESERHTRFIAELWRWGFVDAVKTDGHQALSGYLAKYMSKAMHDKRLIGKRAYSASRNVARPHVLNTPWQIETMLLDWGIAVDNPALHTFEYDTLHLGRCVYKQFVIE